MTTTKIVYVRCNGGHLFSGASCPFDGWGAPETVRLRSIVERIPPGELDVKRLRDEGVDEHTLSRVLIVEFGDDRSQFEALAPEYLHVNGTTLSIHEVDQEFL